MPPATLSVTDISSYLFCPRKLYLGKVLGIREPPNKAMTLGTIRHSVFEHYTETEKTIISDFSKGMSKESLVDMFKLNLSGVLRAAITKKQYMLQLFQVPTQEAFVAAWPSVMGEINRRTDLIYEFASKNSVYGQDLSESFFPKLLAELRVNSDKLRLKGIIDRIEVYPDTYIPYELKTGSMPKEGLWPSHRVQIAAYCMLLSEHFNKSINKGFVSYLDQGEERRITMNPFIEDEVKNLISDVFDMLSKKEAPECGKPKFCNCISLEKQRTL